MTKTKPPKAQPEPQTPAIPEEEAPAAIIARRVTLNDTSLSFSEDTTFAEWREVYTFVDKLQERGKWWLADTIRFAEGKFPDRYTQAIELTGLSYSRLTTIVSVGGKIEPARRRKELPFSFHEVVAYAPYQTGDHLLDRCIKEHWTRDQLSDALAVATGQPTKAEKKTRKSSGTAAKVAASGKTPQDPLDPAALVWNGYPLATRDRVVYQGSEALDDTEADRAAHFHKFQHAQALMNWLEEHKFLKGGDEPCAQHSPTDNASAPKELPKAIPSATACPVEGASSGAPLSDPTVAPVLTPTAAPAPAQQASEPVPATLQPKAPETPPAPAQTPIEIAEGHILAFNIASLSVDWKAVPPMAAKRWLNTLLARADTIIDILQGEPVTPRK